MTTPACSPEFPWTCPPGVREQMLRAAWVDARQRESGAWFDEWKRTRISQPPPNTHPVNWISGTAKNIGTGFTPPELGLRDAPPKLSNPLSPPNNEIQPPRIREPPLPKPLIEAGFKVPRDWVWKETAKKLEAVRKFDAVTPLPKNIALSPEVKPFEEAVVKPKQRAGEDLDETVIKRLEEQRQREAELWGRLDQQKSMQMPRGWMLPRLIELPIEPHFWPPWRWKLIEWGLVWGPPKPIEWWPRIELFKSRRRREVLA